MNAAGKPELRTLIGGLNEKTARYGIDIVEGGTTGESVAKGGKIFVSLKAGAQRAEAFANAAKRGRSDHGRPRASASASTGERHGRRTRSTPRDSASCSDARRGVAGLNRRGLLMLVGNACLGLGLILAVIISSFFFIGG